MPAEDAARIRHWHERAYAEARARGAGEQTFVYLDRTFVVPPSVQPITGVSHLLGEAVLAEVRPEDRVLDMGTGSGVNAVLAASRASSVVAVDVNPAAVRAAADNAARNGVANRMQAQESDVFSAVDGRFDLIVFDPPFRWFAPRDLLERATTDENYATLTAFVAGVREHLAPGGRMLIFFGTSGDLAYLRELLDRYRFATEDIATTTRERDGVAVRYFTWRVTPRADS